MTDCTYKCLKCNMASVNGWFRLDDNCYEICNNCFDDNKMCICMFCANTHFDLDNMSKEDIEKWIKYSAVVFQNKTNKLIPWINDISVKIPCGYNNEYGFVICDDCKKNES